MYWNVPRMVPSWVSGVCGLASVAIPIAVSPGSEPEPAVGPHKDVVVTVDDTPIDVPGEHVVPASKRVKFVPKSEEFEMYNVTDDPTELSNLYGRPRLATQQATLEVLLQEQCSSKRRTPWSGSVPGQPTSCGV